MVAVNQLSAKKQLALAIPVMHGQKNLELGVTWSPVPRAFLDSNSVVQGTDEKVLDIINNSLAFSYYYVSDKLAMLEVDFEPAMLSYEELVGGNKEVRQKALKARNNTVVAFKRFLDKLGQQPLGTKQEIGIFCTNSLPLATKLNGEKIPAFAVDFRALSSLEQRFLGMSEFTLAIEVNGRRLPLSISSFGLEIGYDLGGAEMTRDNNALVVSISLVRK